MLQPNEEYYRYEISQPGDKGHRTFLDHEAAAEPNLKSLTRRALGAAGVGLTLGLGACTFDPSGIRPDARVDARPLDDGSIDAGDAGPPVDADFDAALLDAAQPDAAPDANIPDAETPDAEVPDGSVDADVDAYVPPTETGLCHDFIDNDQNGLTDCSDPACVTDATCIACEDILADPDGNKRTKCADVACSFTPDCIPLGTGDCTDPQNKGKRGNIGEFCWTDANGNPIGLETDFTDGVDNNNDGLTDCNSPEGQYSTDCFVGPYEDCRNHDMLGVPIGDNCAAEECAFDGFCWGPALDKNWTDTATSGTCTTGDTNCVWGYQNPVLETCMSRQYLPADSCYDY